MISRSRKVKELSKLLAKPIYAGRRKREFARIAALASALLAISAFTTDKAYALPELDSPRGILVDNVTLDVVRDSDDPNVFYFFPQGLELARDSTGDIRFGFHHWGISRRDDQGSGGNLTFTVVPTWNRDLVAKALAKLKEENPNASLSLVPIAKSYFDIILSSTFASDKTYVSPHILPDDYTIKHSTTLKDLGITLDGASLGDQTEYVLESVSGGPGNGEQAFTATLSNLGGRLSVETPATQTGDADFFGVRFRYMVKGVTPKFKAKLSVNWKKSFEHFHARVSTGGWFSRASAVVDIQEMKQSGAITLEVLSGAVDDKNETLIDSVFESLVNARINGTGMFQPQLRPAAVGGGGGGGFGWGLNASSSFQKLTEEVTQDFIIDKQNIQHRAYSLGGSFGMLCVSNPSKFVNLSEPSKPCVSDADLRALSARVTSCWEEVKPQLDMIKDTELPASIRDAIAKQVNQYCGV